MPDLKLMLGAMLVAAVAAAATVGLIAGLPPARRLGWIIQCSVLGLGVGSFLGFYILGFHPRWPPLEDQDRFLLLVFPSFLVEESVVLGIGLRRFWVWLVRGCLAAATAPVLLHGSSYLADLAGPGSREWPPALAAIILGGLGLAFASEWSLLDRAIKDVPAAAVVGSLVLATIGAALTMMLSGYATGAQMGFPVASAIAGAWTAGLVVPGKPRVEAAIGIGLGVVYSLVVIGRFFAQLTTVHAMLLFFAPLLCVAFELPLMRRLNPCLQSCACLILVGCLVGGLVASAALEFSRNS